MRGKGGQGWVREFRLHSGGCAVMEREEGRGFGIQACQWEVLYYCVGREVYRYVYRQDECGAAGDSRGRDSFAGGLLL